MANYVPTANGAKAIVEVHNCFNKIQYVYGGGNAATVPETQVTIHGGTIGYVYGGGYGSNSTSAHVGYKTTGVTPASATASDTNGTGNTSVTIKGGAITSVFGGNNSAGTVRGTATVSIAKEGGCTMDITNVYGGGNVAPCTRTAVNIGCTGSEPIDYVFGGANAAPVTGNIALNITGGKIGSAFGGNNASGAIGGTVAVTVEWGGDCDKSLGYVFGGGKDAAYDGTPTVNIKNGTVTYDVFGGGQGSEATVTGTSVTVGDLTSGHDSYAAVVSGGVYGGGQQAAVNGNASVTIQQGNTQVNSVFGGGQQASVTGNADIDMTLGTVTAGIYGGCNVQGAVGGTATLDITGGTVGAAGEGHSANIYGGGLGADTRMSGNVVVNIGATTGGKTPTYSGSATLYGNVYGGSAKGKTNCTDAATPAYVSDTKTDVNLYGGTVNGSLFGGGHGIDNAVADVYGPVTVTVAGGKVTGGVFGCNDQNGTPKGTVTVNITGSAADANAIANVYGGGNVAHYDPTPSTNGYPQVTVSGCSTKVGNVHGGGNAAAVPQTSVVINGGIIANVFGGGLGQAAPAHVGYKNTDNTPSSYPYGNGTASVAIHGGRIGNVYGGNNAGGTVRGKITATADWSDTNCNSKSLGYLYGGGYGAKTRTNGDVEVNISGATVTHDVYGGSALGSVCDATSDTVTVNVLAGTVNGNIYGGGLGKAGAADSGQVNGTVIVNIGNSSGGSAIIGGMVFGCNNTNGSPKGDVYVNVYHTAHTDSVNDFAALMGKTTGDTVADLNAVAALYETKTHADSVAGDALFAIKAVYGGGNQADYNPANLTTDTCHVHIYGCTENTIKYVYGGGRAASSNLTDVVIEGGHIYQAFAGGDGSSGTGANIGFLPDGTTNHGPGNTNITVMGGAIYQTFGGSNTKGIIRGTSTVDLNKSCDQLNIVEVFGGNNLAPFNGDKVVTIKCGTKWNDVYGGSNKAPITGDVTLNIVGGKMNRAFGGSKAAQITGDVTVNVYGGSIGELYGGNNVSGNITGKITVNVDWTDDNTCSDTKYLGYVYGGGNMAVYTPNQVDNKVITSPEVNIIKGTVSHAVFGGGYGSGATVSANPLVVIGADRTKNMAGTTIATVSNQSVTIGTDKNTTGATVDGNVFGGGNAAAVTGNTTVIVKGTGTTVYNNIYGGGNAATVTGSTDVHIGADPIVPEPEPEPEP